MKPVLRRELDEYAPLMGDGDIDDEHVMVPETLHTRLVATRNAYLAVCQEIDQFKKENS